MSQPKAKNDDNRISLILESKLIDFSDVDRDLNAEAYAIISSALEQSKPQENPLLIHLCGIPGSGKTTYANRFVADHPEYSLVQFDAVMEKLSGYQMAKKAGDLVKAFTQWELHARAIGYHLLQALIEGRRHVIFDHSAAFPAHLILIDHVREKGYVVEMHHLACSPELALERVRTREQIIQRHTPEKLIWERAQLLDELKPQYREKVDIFIEVGTNEVYQNTNLCSLS